MNRRQLKKQDKRAAALMIGTGEFRPQAFGMSDDGRFHVEWRCSYEYDEWDSCPAWDKWLDLRVWEHPSACAWYGFDDRTGMAIPEDQRSRGMRPHEAREFYALRAPAGFRWRGRRVVPVDQHGAMVRRARR